MSHAEQASAHPVRFDKNTKNEPRTACHHELNASGGCMSRKILVVFAALVIANLVVGILAIQQAVPSADAPLATSDDGAIAPIRP